MKLALHNKPPKLPPEGWNPWFAWHPVFDRWSDTKATMIWLETVERRWHVSKHSDNGWWEYRPVDGSLA